MMMALQTEREWGQPKGYTQKHLPCPHPKRKSKAECKGGKIKHSIHDDVCGDFNYSICIFPGKQSKSSHFTLIISLGISLHLSLIIIHRNLN